MASSSSSNFTLSNHSTALAIGASTGIAITLIATTLSSYFSSRSSSSHPILQPPQSNLKNLNLLRTTSKNITSDTGVFYNSPNSPPWLQHLFTDKNKKRVYMREWEDIEWRDASGWTGRDLIHDPNGSGVKVHAYFWEVGKMEVTGIVEFGTGAESHRGLCHGGSVTSLFDDICGHIAFFVGDSPWCGATVQVNCSLKKPVQVNSILLLTGQITKIENKKVYITAILSSEDGAVHAVLEHGLSIMPADMNMGRSDDVSERVWVEGYGGDGVLDSGWLL